MKRTTLDSSVVPLQPQMKQPQLCYQEKLVKWNPYSMKNLALCYEFQTGREAETLELVPDACLDFMFRFDGSSATAIVTGVQSAPLSVELEPNAVYFGFKPYSAKGMHQYMASWAELANRRVDFRDLFACDTVLEQLIRAGSFDERVDAVCAFAGAELADEAYTPDFVEYAELKLCATRGNLKVEDLAEYTGYSSRYCREKFKEANGISIKHYSNIIRFQNVIRMLGQDTESISDIVFENGYFDQPHLSREFKQYAGDSPLHYRQKFLRQA